MDEIIEVTEELNNSMELIGNIYLPFNGTSEFIFEEDLEISIEIIDHGINWLTLDL